MDAEVKVKVEETCVSLGGISLLQHLCIAWHWASLTRRCHPLVMCPCRLHLSSSKPAPVPSRTTARTAATKAVKLITEAIKGVPAVRMLNQTAGLLLWCHAVICLELQPVES